ncbi:MAG: hypothetical protein FH753_05560 [Firmicutes bacterium]|nr:hypothetical protein [Bacillota bacterium]
MVKWLKIIVPLCILFVVVGFFYGFYRGSNITSEKPIDDYEDSVDNYIKEKLNDNVNLMNDEVIIGPNTLIEYVIYYKECGHTTTEIEKATKNIINLNKEEYTKYANKKYKNYEIVKFKQDEVILKINKDHLCPEHFIISIKDGKIAVYGIDDNGEEKILKIIDQPIELLKKIDQEKLNRGIRVDSEEELNSILQDFTS